MSLQAPRAAARSIGSIRQLATGIREMLGYETGEIVRMDRLLEHRLPQLLPDFLWDVKSREEMGDIEGLAQPDRDRILIREDVYAALRRNEGRARFTLAHEVGHLVMHQKDNLVLARSGHGRVSKLSCPEWQANQFAAEFLMDAETARKLNDELALCSHFGVSVSAARRRLIDLGREAQSAGPELVRPRAKKPDRQEMWRT